MLSGGELLVRDVDCGDFGFLFGYLVCDIFGVVF